MMRPAIPFPKLCVVDLDGTLVDTAPDLAYCMDRTLLSLGLEAAGVERVRGWIGEGLDTLLARALAELGGAAAPELEARARAMFLRLYETHTSTESAVYEGVREGLAFLRRHGSALACVTNKTERFTRRLLEDLDLYAEFGVVVSGDSLPTKKPDPAPLLFAAARLGTPAEECLLIGDTVTDIRAARAANFKIICVRYGYNPESALREAQPDAFIDSMSELESLLVKAA